MIKLASFDIFDTTLIRKCGRAENIFYLLAKELFPNDELHQTSFFMWRLEAEKNAVKEKNNADLMLSDIYSQYKYFGEEIIDKETALQAEKKLESQQLVYNDEVKKLISEKRAQGYTICFISDMYLDSRFLKDVLIREGCAEKQDDVFVSCEHKKRKSNGTLYKLVMSHFPNRIEWVHYGDNKQSDFRMAKKMGANAILIDFGFTKSENLIETKCLPYSFGREMSVLIGFQRAARLHLSNKNVDYTNAADFVASSLIPYFFYINEIARKYSFKRLYFLSRDSYILYELANKSKIFSNIDCRYLFISRKSLALPLLSEISKEKLSHLLGGNLIGKRVIDILGPFKLDSLSSKMPFNKIESENELDTFISVLQDEKERISRMQKDERAILDQYLQQEGVYDDCSFAMVDVGWLGTTRLMINDLRKDRGVPSIPFIYLGCRKDVLSRSCGDFFAFLPCDFITYDKTVLIESYFCASKYPSTLGYRRCDGRITPVFGKDDKNLETLSTIHVAVCDEILNYIEGNIHLLSGMSFSIWGQFVEVFSSHPSYINYSTLKKLKSPDRGHIIEKISLGRFFKYITTGKMDGCLPINSIYDTFGIVFRNHWILKYLVRR